MTRGSLLVDHIGELVTNDGRDGDPLGVRREAALLIEDGQVAWVGSARDAPAADRRIDAGGAAVLPGFVDSHAHLVFAGDRAAEFAARMAGERYTGGGIRTTVGATRAASDDALRASVGRLRAEMLRQGTTTVEIKSGYGLTVADEARSLRIAAEFTDDTTFLGAHVV
ncbi:imidazolonepropionase, partial [Micromonospora sp. CPCC 205714]